MKTIFTNHSFIGLIVLALTFINQPIFSQNILDNAGISTSVPVSAAYGLRLLSTNYIGNAIQVRRSNDNATQNIGFTANGDLDTAALKSFTGSNSAYVITWYDQSGNAQHLAQANAANQPLIVTNGIVNRQEKKPFIQFVKIGSVYNSLVLPVAMTTVGHVSAVHRMAPGSYGFILGHSVQYFWHSTPGSTLIDASLASASIRNAAAWSNGVAAVPATIPWPSTLTVNQLEPSAPGVQTLWDNIGRDRVYHQVSDGGYSELIVFPSALSAENRSALASNQMGYFLNQSALPVSWNSFTANYRGGNVLLNWQTTEQHVKEYTVQHSTNGNAWSGIANLSAAGDGFNSYTYTHLNVAGGNNYYRVLQTDVDGKFSYSAVRMVTAPQAEDVLFVRNNLISDGRLHLSVKKGMDVSLYDVAGGLVWKKHFASGSHTVSVSNLQKGMYFINSGDRVEKIVVR